MTAFTFLDAYKAARRPGKPGRDSRWVPAAEAFRAAARNLSAVGNARADLERAQEALKAAAAIDSRRYAPGMERGRADVSAASRAYDIARRRVTPHREGRNPEPAQLNRGFTLHGSRAVGQWCEAPPFRFVGLSRDIAPDRQGTQGYYLDSDESETATGAVYQCAPTRDGRARFIPAIPDPVNADSDGEGPAMLFIGEMETADSRDESDAEEARAAAARRAMGLAEIYAERERETEDAAQAGFLAGEALQEAADARAQARAILKERREARGTAAFPALCKAIRAQVSALLETVREKREEAAKLERGEGFG